jgi:hypothetical protein
MQWKTVPQGAATSVWAAVVASAAEIGGRYCENCHVANVVAEDVAITWRQRGCARICARSRECRSSVEEKRRNGGRVFLAFLISNDKHNPEESNDPTD